MAAEKKTRVLQIGMNDWTPILNELPQFNTLQWKYLSLNELDKFDEKSFNQIFFNVVLFTDNVEKDLFIKIDKFIDAHTLIIDEKVKPQIDQYIVNSKLPIFMNLDNQKKVIEIIERDFFAGQFGQSMAPNQIHINEQFSGQSRLDGEIALELEGNFSSVLNNNPIVSWQYNIPINNRTLDIVLQFEHSPKVKIIMQAIKVKKYSNTATQVLTFDESQMSQGVQIEGEDNDDYLIISLLASGKGILRLGQLHYRNTRHGFGEFLLGGQRILDKKFNDEIFYLFNPGDLKPPLNVYFSGYRSAEGFEGYFMMKNLGSPFLLITDPRLEGGSFYLGDDFLEKSITNVIKQHLKKLGFSNKELILSGLSMGTFGALYNAIKLRPEYVIIGKPLASIGNIAENYVLERPNDFGTSLDMLMYLEGDLSKRSVSALNKRFWEPFKEANLSGVNFVITYMEDDDFDGTAYYDLLEVISDKGANVISKGIPGRHNDATSSIIEWYLAQYNRILHERYDREV